MKIQIGRFEVYPLLDGYFRLDGGMMFRQAKMVWQNLYTPDMFNRIRLAARCYLIKGKTLTLFDAGMGNPQDPMFPLVKGFAYSVFFGIDQSAGNLITNLEGAGFGKDDPRFVTQSHLHLDHTGWHTFTDADGKIMPTFSKADYLVHQTEWQAAVKSHSLSLKSYRPEAFLPLLTADSMFRSRHVWPVRGDAFELEPGLRFLRTGGHTRGHWSALIESDGQTAFFAGDLIPTHKHIAPANVMSYDLYPTRVHKEKIKFLNRAASEKWLILFDHDPDFAGGYVFKTKEGRFEFKPLEGAV